MADDGGFMGGPKDGPGEVKFGARLRRPAPSARQLLGGAGVEDGDARKGVQSVDIAFAILRVLEGADRPLSLGEVAQRAGQQPSKVHHYLVSLVRNGAAAQNAAGRYDLGTYALDLGLSALQRLDAVERGAEAVVDFRDATGESAFVAVWGNKGPTTVRYAEGARSIAVEARAGLVLPLLTSATGHAVLTWAPEPLWARLAELERRDGPAPGATPPDPAVIRAATAQRGIAMVSGDLLPRIAALSVPGFTHDGRLACILTTLGWKGELDTAPNGPTAVRLHAAGHGLSRSLGYRDQYPALAAS